MAETVYTSTTSFENIVGERVVSISVGSGASVVIEVEHGNGQWVEIDTFHQDAVQALTFGYGRNYRFTVTGDASFAI